MVLPEGSDATFAAYLEQPQDGSGNLSSIDQTTNSIKKYNYHFVGFRGFDQLTLPAWDTSIPDAMKNLIGRIGK